jgi:hypothetical protein
MIEIKITPDMLDRANKLYEFHNIRNSITSGKSQDYGALGEVMVMDYYGLDKDAYSPTKDYDLIFGKGTVDVKSKLVTTKPRNEYYCAVTAASYDHQQCDYYCFVRIMKDMSIGWICGFIKKNDMVEKGHFYQKGDIDPTSHQKFQFKDDCHNIAISKLSLKKSNKINKFFFDEKGFEIENNTKTYYVTKYKQVQINGFDENIRILYDSEYESLIVQHKEKGNLFNGYCSSLSEFVAISVYLRIKI